MSLPEALRRPLTIPVMAAPMFIASSPELVIAQCRAGIIGSFPALNARGTGQLNDWLDQIEEAAQVDESAVDPVGPFAVNLIVHRTNARLEDDLRVVVEHEVPIVVTSLGAKEEVNEAVHSYGGVVLHDVIDNRFARKAIEKGANGLVAVAAGAGGHAGATSPFALLGEIRQWFDGPLLLSGAIADGRTMLAAQIAGADLAYVGSAFLASDEAAVVEEYKQMIVNSSASDVVYTDHFTGVRANYLRGSIEAVGLDPDNLAGGASSLDAEAVTSGAEGGPKAWRDIWGSGQGIGAVMKRESVAQMVSRWRGEYRRALDNPVWTGPVDWHAVHRSEQIG